MKEILIKIIKKASKILEKYFYSLNIEVDFKSKNNPVTQADKESEEIIKEFISKKFPNDKIICEESCPTIKEEIDPHTRYWVIDPLDGTVNFTHKLPIFCISIGIIENKEIKEGIVYNPITKDLYYAKKGTGAYKNNKKILVSKIENLYNSLLVTGFPYYTYKNPKRVFKLFNKFSTKAQAIRRLGSAALDLCMVAEGIFEGFWEENLKIWDVAAGSLIVKEAGGKITDYYGGDNYLFGKTIVASNGKIHNQMLKIIRECMK
ncbi:MAG: inositol monophosphatase family protein [Elusimicrobiota bacterium]|nr:inositol monophosphatase [Endomicrobiia bacterium]MCX7641301.1 inositol monophosphatase [Elusimicrobiales bacterium]MDW8166327.1 inositol monophosphatase family protein [Elusimicrobiota bacterium]